MADNKSNTEVKEEIIELLNSTGRDGIDDTIAFLEESGFFTAPASTCFHLSEPGGLVKHSVHVYERLRELYSNELARNTDGPVILSDEDEEKIAICGLLHDWQVGSASHYDTYYWCHLLLSIEN